MMREREEDRHSMMEKTEERKLVSYAQSTMTVISGAWEKRQ